MNFKKKVVDSLKKTLLTLFLIIVAALSNGCWLAGHTCSDGHISSFILKQGPLAFLWINIFYHRQIQNSAFITLFHIGHIAIFIRYVMNSAITLDIWWPVIRSQRPSHKHLTWPFICQFKHLFVYPSHEVWVFINLVNTCYGVRCRIWMFYGLG